MAADGALLPQHYAAAPVCAPSRASLLLGRSQGHANVRDNQFDKALENNLTLGSALQLAGYTTAAIGKWGLQGQIGKAPNWTAHPLNRGFDYYLGYIRHVDGHEHYPKEGLYRNPKEVYENRTNIASDLDKCYTADLWTAAAKKWIVDHKRSRDTDKPFFMYLAFGACHFPFHAPDDYIERQKNNYAQGWDELRRERFRTQRQLGVIPKDAKLAPRNEGVPDWESLSDTERRIAARGQQVYAAFLEHANDQLQRLVDFLEAEKQLDDTIVVLLSDNGAAVSGQPLGTLDLRRSAYIDKESTEHLAKYQYNLFRLC